MPFSGSKKGKNRCKQCKCIGHRAAGCPLNGPKPRYEVFACMIFIYN
jgi:hypothetical protein